MDVTAADCYTLLSCVELWSECHDSTHCDVNRCLVILFW